MNPSVPALLEARGVARRYGKRSVLTNVDLSLAGGEVVLLVGPNGAGKSTLLRCMAGLARPTAGTVMVGGRSVHSDPTVRGRLGLLGHQTAHYDDLTARETLRFAGALHGLHAVEKRVRDALDASGLVGQADQQAGTFSRGMLQRLALARATLHDPEILLLDEPFAGLDVPGASWLRGRLAAGTPSGRAVLCVTHDPSEIWEITTRVVVLIAGQVRYDAPRPADLQDFERMFAGWVAA